MAVMLKLGGLVVIQRVQFVEHSEIPYVIPIFSLVQVQRYHGVSSLSQDLNGAFISASCTDSRYSNSLKSVFWLGLCFSLSTIYSGIFRLCVPNALSRKTTPCPMILFLSILLSFRIYLYNVLQAEKGPVKTFKGCKIESFFVKVSAILKFLLLVTWI